jgi:cytochrome d ubiquinol oxidase subunit II
VFLVSKRAGRRRALERYFRRRAIGSAVAAGLLAIAGAYVLERDAPFVFEGLVRAGQPFIFFSAAAASGASPDRERNHAGRAGLAIGAVVAVLAGWGVAQYPYLLPTSLSIAEGAGAPATLRWVPVRILIVVGTVVPALALLFVLDRARRLEERSKNAAAGSRIDRRRGPPPEVVRLVDHVPSR